MKTDALTNTLIATALAGAILLLGVGSIDLTKVDSLVAWAAAGATIAMIPVSYRSVKKGLFGL